ncbi:hypothetical protein AVEN_143279-1 [Araneus ventricosus]|uniref:Uncharacterized protein n=1 Tax=Araneus ventricosus TaxID=182803 RepID=A0A4Y2ADN0_ARAVE|nr:hypothetical protein AVEN_143279-1 [Araneus ventricosus]
MKFIISQCYGASFTVGDVIALPRDLAYYISNSVPPRGKGIMSKWMRNRRMSKRVLASPEGIAMVVWLYRYRVVYPSRLVGAWAGDSHFVPDHSTRVVIAAIRSLSKIYVLMQDWRYF